MGNIYTLGIDIGSTSSKCVMMKNGKEIIGKSLVDVGAGTSGPKRAIEKVLADVGMEIEDVSFILATGYGRKSIKIAHAEMSELSCHAKGAYFLNPEVRTIIDIGGQDAKVMKVGHSGMLINFVMNDKCAAGTGRFLDVMSRVLEVKVEDFEKMTKQSTNIVNISSTCTVFAESEVISQLANDAGIADIIGGICRSVANKVGSMAKRMGLENEVVMTGGVALNGGVVKALEDELKLKIHTSPLAQYNGAIGAAINGYHKYLKSK